MCEARQEEIFHKQYVQNQLKELKEAREEAIFHEQYVQKQLSEKDAKLSEQQNLIEQLQAENKKLKEKLK